ncbi:MAG: type I DNA topoisomerase [Clostridia bacterium]
MKLVLIEGPGKRESIKKYLGAGYEVFATKGHIRDLPATKFGVDILNGYKPSYEVMATKRTLIKDLKDKASKAEAIYLATDPDREGEAIAWHLAHILGLKENALVRTAFNEISKPAIQASIANPRAINMDLVNAQQARRVLDRIMGYKLSPLLSRKIRNKLSGGRVQSVVLKIIVDREKAIRDFVKEEYWNISALLLKTGDNKAFKSELTHYNNAKINIPNETECKRVENELKLSQFVVDTVKRSVVEGKTPPPYITSTLQQDAIKKLKMTLNTYTKSAQSLYEGVDIDGEGKVALVTYIRTDSVRVSPEAQNMAKEYIINNFGEQYAPKKFNVYGGKKNVQDAHEAIRPISLKYTPQSLQGRMDANLLKLYTLIFNRFLASQMTNAKYDSLTVEIKAGDYKFKSSGKALIFDGFTRIFSNTDDEDEKSNGINIPNLVEGEVLSLTKLDTEQRFTKPPVRFNESTIIKEMEDKGIGRPATYASTIMTLLTREYVVKETKNLVPTELGEKVTEYLEKYFDNLMNIKFTAEMEEHLDEVEFKGIKWESIVDAFYKDFIVHLNEAERSSESMKGEAEPTGIICNKCGAMMVYREGKFGKFIACSNYPSCKNTQNLNQDEAPEEMGPCPTCGATLQVKRSKKGDKFYGCSNWPKCNFAHWDMPLNEKCTKCGNQMYKHISPRSEKIYCANKECK